MDKFEQQNPILKIEKEVLLKAVEYLGKISAFKRPHDSRKLHPTKN